MLELLIEFSRERARTTRCKTRVRTLGISCGLVVDARCSLSLPRTPQTLHPAARRLRLRGCRLASGL